MKKNLLKAALLLCCVMAFSSCGDTANSFNMAIANAMRPWNEAEQRAHRQALTEWQVGEETDETAVQEFGYDNCFRVCELSASYTDDAQYLYLPVSDLREVRSLVYWQAPGEYIYHSVVVGTVICHKSIAADLCAIFKQLYEEKYSIQSLMPLVYDFPMDYIISSNFSFCYSYNTTDYVEDKHHQGKAVCLNPKYPPVDGDKAVNLFAQKGFTWDGQYTFEK